MAIEINYEKMDVGSCFNTKPLPMDFILPGFVASTVGCLAAAGSTGKSFASLEIAMGICCNDADKKLLNMDIKKEGSVAIFNAEDPQTVIHDRLHSISSHLTVNTRHKVASKLDIYPLVGKQADIMLKEWQDFILRVAEGKRLLVFDTLTRWHKLDENSNGQMSQVIGALEMIATKSGASIIFLHHTGKSAAMNGEQDKQQSTRGASAIVDNCRWQGFMQTMTEDEAKRLGVHPDNRKSYVQIGGNKENYGAPTNAKWLKRSEGGVLLTANDIKTLNKPNLSVVNSNKKNEEDILNESKY